MQFLDADCIILFTLKSWQIVALSHSLPKAVQSVEIWAHPTSLKVEPINNFNCHIHAQCPKISEDLLLAPPKHFHY
jgi:hypothetical protein